MNAIYKLKPSGEITRMHLIGSTHGVAQSEVERGECYAIVHEAQVDVFCPSTGQATVYADGSAYVPDFEANDGIPAWVDRKAIAKLLSVPADAFQVSISWCTDHDDTVETFTTVAEARAFIDQQFPDTHITEDSEEGGFSGHSNPIGATGRSANYFTCKRT